MAKPKKDTTTQNTVFVYANLPNGQSFHLPGRVVTLKGFPVSRLLDVDGNQMPAGQYGVTELPADDWNAVQKIYGQMTLLKSDLIFVAPSREEGDAMAAERQGLRHGLEPVDPEGDETVTSPSSDTHQKGTAE